MVVGDLQIRETTETNRETRLCSHHHHQYHSHQHLNKTDQGGNAKNNAKIKKITEFPSTKWFSIEAVMSFPIAEVIKVLQ